MTDIATARAALGQLVSFRSALNAAAKLVEAMEGMEQQYKELSERVAAKRAELAAGVR